MPPQIEEYVLSDLFGERSVSQYPLAQAVNGTTVASVDLSQRSLMPTPDADDQGGIAGLSERDHRALFVAGEAVDEAKRFESVPAAG